uniref:Uncharacterized protein n=1 Tax=Setaria italica TaxID=4555 RepID=K4APH2_SETIT
MAFSCRYCLLWISVVVLAAPHSEFPHAYIFVFS